MRLASADNDADLRDVDRWVAPEQEGVPHPPIVVGGRANRNGSTRPPSVDQVGDDLVVDRDDLVARVDGREIPLTPMQAGILEVLVTHTGQVVHRSSLQQRVWGTDNPLFNSAVERQVEVLQQELGDNPAEPSRITVSGAGYRYRPPGFEKLNDAN